MKKSWVLTAAALFAVMLIGCGDRKAEEVRDSKVDMVKNGVLNRIDKTRTVEQMFSAKYKDLKWRRFISDNNQQVVEVTGVRAFSEKEKSEFEQSVKQLREVSSNGAMDNPFGFAAQVQAQSALALLPLVPHDGDRILLQFILNADGESFVVGYGELRDRNGDLKKITVEGVEVTSTTESAYENGYKFIKACVK